MYYFPVRIKNIGAIFTKNPSANMTSSGVWGGNEFATTEEAYHESGDGGITEPAQKFYRVFSPQHEWQINNVAVDKYYWGKFYNPQPIHITSMQFQNSDGQFSPIEIKVYGSNDDNNYTLLGTVNPTTVNNEIKAVEFVDNKEKFKYFKVEAKPRNTTALMIFGLYIEAEQDHYVMSHYILRDKVGGGGGICIQVPRQI